LVEMRYILSAIWGYENPSSFAVLLMLFMILILWIAAVTSFMVFQQLCFENYKWWWRSFLNGGACAIFFYFYAIYYFYFHSNLSGFLQVSDKRERESARGNILIFWLVRRYPIWDICLHLVMPCF
jgi:hypothetical protein